ncbi:4-hydroxythreonine-4-phosphate dehydrogenase PdxA [Guyparkeria halophila]|uniref:4-hydroxythreonine-4-phosphate dehydrogenase n=1 Tax=Guyparkeria halophila TaxID=47960 RepID=A0ABZ0YXA9_9GAMM|nr:4-hydroxythreonine-4-phosphate dehydrogenase PdxA [Guyparkeria halophila]WQH16795.1 4-hydroxythreonine-4-phosphate dehydrogenase PdxA [Guyparkeria halophila]
MASVRLVVSSGEPAGIGPDLLLALAADPAFTPPGELVVLGDRDVFAARADSLGLPFDWPAADDSTSAASGFRFHHLAAANPVTPGRLDPGNARHVLAMLDHASEGCRDGRYAAMVTAPLHKGVINDAGIPFTGHTEYLAERVGGTPVMMLAADTLRVALATTHLPLAKVPAAITGDTLTTVLETLHAALVDWLGKPQPRILVAGLNPHAGESGHLGDEEIRVIGPTLEAMRERGIQAIGPLPADTLFTPRHLDGADAVLAMYHDQGLPVLKYAGFGRAVNVTLGLPIVRTSVDHGTALDLAGTGRAEHGSLAAAIALAAEITQRAAA